MTRKKILWIKCRKTKLGKNDNVNTLLNANNVKKKKIKEVCKNDS